MKFLDFLELPSHALLFVVANIVVYLVIFLDLFCFHAF